MRKKGFTISEIIIALCIIGVVASLTTPQLINNYRKKIFSTSLATAVSDFEKAMTTLIQKDNLINLKQNIVDEDGEIDEDKFINEINKVMYSTQIENPVVYKQLNNNETKKFPPTDKAITLKSKKGIDYYICFEQDADLKSESEALLNGSNYLEQVAEIYIDTNGFGTKPDIKGRDIFRFDLSVDGHLYPYGGNDYDFYHGEIKGDYKEDGDFCAEYLLKNGYNMDY
ncbi:type II secretion system protein [bacterium]|nr:type II secretion system protein [bacterium]